MIIYTNTTITQTDLGKLIGNIIPSATQSAKPITPQIEATNIGAFFLYTKKPNTIANGINHNEAVATEPFAPPPANELATISANAATTSKSTNQANTVKSTLHFLLIVSSITSPSDLPS